MTRKELLSVVSFLQHFRQYLLTQPFTIRTDHGALTWLQQFRNPEGQLARWLEKFQEYQFSIVHRPGKKHGNADAQSRLPCQQCSRASHYDSTTVALLTSNGLTCGYSSDQLRNMQLCDSYIGQVLRWKEQGEQPPTDFVKTHPVPLRRFMQQWDQLVVNKGILYRQYAQPNSVHDYLQLVVPTEMRESILRELHARQNPLSA